jgi:hypothetical protein
MAVCEMDTPQPFTVNSFLQRKEALIVSFYSYSITVCMQRNDLVGIYLLKYHLMEIENPIEEIQR